MDVSGIVNTADIFAQNTLDSRRADETNRFTDLLQRAIDARDSEGGVGRTQIRQAAEMFEAYFLQMMFREMRNTTFDEQGLFPRSNAEKIFTDMLDEEVANTAASRSALGLADMIYAQMTRGL